MSQPLPFASIQQRITLVDSLRGFALMGLFIVHCVEYFELYWLKSEPSWVHDVIFFLFGGKAYAIFAMLFGVSFFIIMDRQAAKGVDFSARFVWRLVVLFAIGYLHGLIYSGDILVVLSLFGLSLVVVNRLPSPWIFVLSLLCLLNIPLLYHFTANWNHWPGSNVQPTHWGLYDTAFKVWSTGSFSDVLSFNAWGGQNAKWFFFFESGRGMQLFGLFMWGLLLGRARFFVNPEKFREAMQRIYSGAILSAVALFSLQYWLNHQPKDFMSGHGIAKYYLDNIVDGYFCIAFMLILVLSFVYLYHLRLTHRALQLLSPGGRMSLTIYVSQGLLFPPLYYGYGLGWYDTIGQERALVMGIALFAVQIAIAHWWMKRFYYGPLEWCWRAATYMTVKIPFRKTQPPTQVNEH